MGTAVPTITVTTTQPTKTAVPLTTTSAPSTISEQSAQIISLAGPIAAPEAEISGLAWYGDRLILLPQFPGRFDDKLFALSKADILAFLDGTQDGPLPPQSIPLIAPDLDQLAGYEGLEAIAFHDDRVFVTVETSGGSPMLGYLAAGRIAPDLHRMELDTTNLVEIVPPAPLANYSDEALLLADDTVLTVYEANGRNVNPAPTIHQFSTILEPVGRLPFPAVEYRVTDATAVDENGRFWVINYLFPGDISKLDPAPDELGERYGRGPTHANSDIVERLVELQFSDSGTTLTDAPPIQLELLPNDARNWEGIVRLDERGFLLATDKFPETILAFVAFPD
jgi:hypothetical protein